jgi:hypothetical protein
MEVPAHGEGWARIARATTGADGHGRVIMGEAARPVIRDIRNMQK